MGSDYGEVRITSIFEREELLTATLATTELCDRFGIDI